MEVYVVSFEGEPIHVFKNLGKAKQFVLWYIGNHFRLTEDEFDNEEAFINENGYSEYGEAYIDTVPID